MPISPKAPVKEKKVASSPVSNNQTSPISTPPADIPKESKEEPSKAKLAFPQISKPPAEPPSENLVVNPSPATPPSPVPAETVPAKEIAEDFKPEEIAKQSFIEEDEKTDSKLKKPILIVVFVLILALTAGGTYFFISKNKITIPFLNFQNNREGGDTLNKVSQLILLPQGETPKIETVDNPEDFKTQPFFTKAEKGDLVLIFENAKKAIIYRPGINKIIDVATITDGTSQSTSSTETPKSFKFVILNATSKPGLAKKYQETLKSKIESAQIVSVGDAKNKDVEKTFIASLNEADASQIATTLGIEKGDLPEGEDKPEADYVIFLGTDQAQ